MSDYNRSTKECTFQQLRPELAKAIRAVAEKKELGDVAGTALVCIETTNEKKKKGLFAAFSSGDPDPVHFVAAVLTPGHFLWARSGAKSGTVASAMRLRELEVKDYDSPLIPDTGLDITGFRDGAEERETTFLGLGSEPAAQKFSDALKQAARSAHAG